MVLCGRDAAERVVGCTFDPPCGFRTRIHTLPMVADMGHISASEVRRRIRAQEPWQHLVPEPIVDQVGMLYGS